MAKRNVRTHSFHGNMADRDRGVSGFNDNRVVPLEIEESSGGGAISTRSGGKRRASRQWPRWLRTWPLSIPVAVHYTFVTIALITTGRNPWIPAYFFSHIVVILAGVWAARDEKKIQPVLLYMYIITMSAILDCLQIGLFVQSYNQESQEQTAIDRGVWLLSVTAVGLHLLMKPMCLVFGVFVILERRPDLCQGSCCCQSGETGEYDTRLTQCPT